MYSHCYAERNIKVHKTKRNVHNNGIKQLVAAENIKKTTPPQCSLAQQQRMTLYNFLSFRGNARKISFERVCLLDESSLKLENIFRGYRRLLTLEWQLKIKLSLVDVKNFKV